MRLLKTRPLICKNSPSKFLKSLDRWMRDSLHLVHRSNQMEESKCRWKNWCNLPLLNLTWGGRAPKHLKRRISTLCSHRWIGTLAASPWWGIVIWSAFRHLLAVANKLRRLLISKSIKWLTRPRCKLSGNWLLGAVRRRTPICRRHWPWPTRRRARWWTRPCSRRLSLKWSKMSRADPWSVSRASPGRMRTTFWRTRAMKRARKVPASCRLGM